MKQNNQPGYLPHVGPASPTKPPRDHRKNLVDQVRDAFDSARERLVESFRSLKTYKADAILLSGKERHSGESLRVFYFGVGENLAYLTELLYAEHEAAIQATDVAPWRAGRWWKTYQSQVDLVILDLPWPVCRMAPGDGFLSVAPWVNMVVPIADTWEAVVERWSKNVRGEDLRRIRKYQLNYRITDSEQAFRNFYHAFYVPYVSKRFGDAVFIEPEQKVVSVHEYGELIEIVHEDTVIAAGILIEIYNSLGFHWTGMPDDLEPRMRDAAFAALYYFILRLAYERGFHEVDCFTSRPTLGDGVLRYKRKWGAMLSGYEPLNGDILLKPMRLTPGLTAFLGHNPLISLVDGNFVARLLFEEPDVSAARVTETVDNYFTDGLQAMRLYSLQGFGAGVEEALRERNLPVQLVDLHQAERPLELYCSS